MRFSAIIGDSKNIEAFSKIVFIVSKLCKRRYVIRLTPNEFCFVNAYNVRESYSLDFRINQSQMFSSYVFDGISQEHNEILFELPVEDLTNSLSTKENMMKMKLTQRNDVPHLVIELRTICIVHEIPIKFILVKNWPDYGMPNAGTPMVVVQLPAVKAVQKILSSLKNIGTHYITIKANNNGELSISGSVDLAKAEVYVRDLLTLDVPRDDSQEIITMDEFFSVQLDLRILYPFVSNLHNYFNRLTLHIIPEKAAIFSARQPDCQVTLCFSGINNE